MPLLIFLLIFMPILELYVIFQVGSLIGILPTIALLLADGFLGAALARSQGRAVWRRFNEAIAAGRPPGREVFDGAAVIMGGTMMLAPGFVTDIFAIGLLAPPTRAILRGFLSRTMKKRAGAPVRVATWGFGHRPGAGGTGPRPQSQTFGGARTRPGPGYDIDASGQEIPDDDPALPEPGARPDDV